MEFLKSILRLDEDQSAHRLAMKYFGKSDDDVDKEYYELESKFVCVWVCVIWTMYIHYIKLKAVT